MLDRWYACPILSPISRLFLDFQALYSKTRALDVIESDTDYHFTGLRLRQQVLDPNSMKRLHRARLPVEESARVTEIMGKISAIARSRQEMKQVGL